MHAKKERMLDTSYKHLGYGTLDGEKFYSSSMASISKINMMYEKEHHKCSLVMPNLEFMHELRIETNLKCEICNSSKNDLSGKCFKSVSALRKRQSKG